LASYEAIYEVKFLARINLRLKKCLKKNEIVLPKIIKQGWNEFSLKNVYPLIKSDKIFESYLPFSEMEQGKWVDKNYFWGIAFTIKPDWANNFYK